MTLKRFAVYQIVDYEEQTGFGVYLASYGTIDRARKTAQKRSKMYPSADRYEIWDTSEVKPVLFESGWIDEKK